MEILVVETTCNNLKQKSVSKKLIGKKVFLESKLTKDIRICELYQKNILKSCGEYEINAETKIILHKYSINNEESFNDYFKKCKIPNMEFEKIWNQIFLENEIKFKILSYYTSMLKLIEKKIDLSHFCLNKAILIYGPPGTGKTSLAKSIANKISIRDKNSFYFLEIDCSSIFSKFYGEGPKILDKIFIEVNELSIKNKVILLIDEIESLMVSRNITMSKNEPLDSIRNVNTFLVCLDKLKANKNVFCIFTTNHIKFLDEAFLDRQDVCIEIGFPNLKNVYEILKNIFEILMKKNLVEYHQILGFQTVINLNEFINEEHKLLYDLTKKMTGKSGRCIRKKTFEAILHNDNNFKSILTYLINLI
ncbi:AAA ATPase [Hamiltosporidium magnivora]|uniref:AAA ATPase n=1 Tax=Hamiltosporidium magnivora TaxID=148818 RepID=A0A4Q9LAL6_9MICR|nr:AAA ATPase [Hamiltosporidium magnivora]